MAGGGCIPPLKRRGLAALYPKSLREGPYKWFALTVAVIILIGGIVLLNTRSHEAAKQLVNTESYSIAVPKDWAVDQLPGGFLSFKKAGTVVGGLEIVNYYPDQPIADIMPANSLVISSNKLNGLFTEALETKLRLSSVVTSSIELLLP